MRSAVLALLVALGCVGCTVGPRHVEPGTELPARFDQAPAASDAAPGPGLWAAFGEAELGALLERSAQASTSIGQAAARLAETRALAGLAIYALVPTVTAEGGTERSRFSGLDPNLPVSAGEFETWRAGFDASWEIDLFGSLRNRRDAIYRRADADAAALAAARLSVAAETAQAWFALLGARERRALLGRQLDSLEDSLRILELQLAAGRANALDVARARSLARGVAAALPEAQAEVVRHEQRLAVLTAWPVEELRRRLDPAAVLPKVPALAVTTSPEEWLRRRPDVREAERRLAAATADVGAEIAEYFPRLELTGSFGWTGPDRGSLGEAAAERWSYGPTLRWRFLDLGRVRQQVRAADARRDGALASYREVVLRALEETENALAGLRAASAAAAELAQAETAAREAARLARLRFDAGASDYLAVLDAERSWLEFADRGVQARTGQATALAAVYKALAGDP